MVQYLKVADYIKQTGKNRASVYRDIKRDKYKTTMLDGIKHIIIEETESQTLRQEKQSETIETGYQDAEIIETTTNESNQIQIYKDSLNNINDLINRIEASKDETINILSENFERQLKSNESLNDVIKTLSEDNSQLRQQMGIRETELEIKNKTIIELKEKIKNMENQSLKEISTLNIQIEELKTNIKSLQDSNKEKDETINSLNRKYDTMDHLYTTSSDTCTKLTVENATLLERYESFKKDYDNIKIDLQLKKEEINNLKTSHEKEKQESKEKLKEVEERFEKEIKEKDILINKLTEKQELSDSEKASWWSKKL